MKEQPFTKEEGEKAAQKHSLGEKKKGLKKEGKENQNQQWCRYFYSFFFFFFEFQTEKAEREERHIFPNLRVIGESCAFLCRPGRCLSTILKKPRESA